MSNTTYRVLVEKLGASNAEQFIGNEGEVFYDPTGSVLRLSDGATPGGIILGGGQSNVWVRPTDWLTMPIVGSTEEKFVGLFAVYDLPENFIALQFEGNYTVDWGDGTSLLKDKKTTYTYPVNGWTWFESIDEAYASQDKTPPVKEDKKLRRLQTP